MASLTLASSFSYALRVMLLDPIQQDNDVSKRTPSVFRLFCLQDDRVEHRGESRGGRSTIQVVDKEQMSIHAASNSPMRRGLKEGASSEVDHLIIPDFSQHPGLPAHTRSDLHEF